MSSMTEEERERLQQMRPDQLVPGVSDRPISNQPPAQTVGSRPTPSPAVVQNLEQNSISPGMSAPGQANNSLGASDINSMFQQYLGRNAAQGGLDYWQQSFNDGATLDDLRYNLAGSDEAYTVANQRVQDSFQGLLGRAAQQQGLDYWRGDLLGGATTANLDYNIRQSAEFGNRITSEVSIAFSQFLERSPTAEEISSLVAAARAGTPLEEIMATIQNSDEAQAIVQKNLAAQAAAAGNANQIDTTAETEVETGSQTSASQAAKEVATYDPSLAAKSGTAGADQAEVTARQVTPQQTVQYQLNQILNSNSPLLQGARTRGLQYANQRGLLNSSIAAQASEQAAIEAATRIAEQDAATYAGADSQTVDAANRAALQDASLGTNVSMFNVGEGNVTNRFNAESMNQAGAFNADAANTAIQSFLTREAQRLMQDDQQLFTAEQNEADRSLRKYLQENEFDFTSSENALDRELQGKLQENQLTFTGDQNELDREQQSTLQENQFAFTGDQNALDRNLASQEAALDRALQTALQESNFAFTGDQNALDRSLKEALQSEQLNWTGDQNQLDRALQTALQNSQLSSNESIANAKIAAEKALQETQLAFAGTEAQLDRDFQEAYQSNAQVFEATQLATQHAFQSMEAGRQREFEQYLQENQNEWAATQNALDIEFKKYQVNAQAASTVMYSTMDGIAAVYADPNLTSQQKTAAAASLMTVSLQMPQLMQQITQRMDPDIVIDDGPAFGNDPTSTAQSLGLTRLEAANGADTNLYQANDGTLFTWNTETNQFDVFVPPRVI